MLGADVMGGSVAGWSSGTGARRSVLIGGAGGGFLAVPGEVSASAGARGRSEERRVGKECRSRWSPYH